MTAVIAGYQSDPVSAAPPPGTVPPGGPAGPHPQTVLSSPGASLSSPGASLSSPGAPTWRATFGRAGTTVASAIGRRRVLSGLGGLVVAGGLAAAGWELTSSGGTATAGTAAGGTTDRRVAWVHPTSGPVRSGAAISTDGGTLYIGSDDGTAYALDAASGRQAGTFRTGGTVSGVTVAGTTLLAGSADRKVHAFATGNLGVSWTSPAAGAAIAGAATSGGGIVYAGSEDGYLYALDFNTGQRKWRTPTGGTTMPSQPTGTGVVWAGSQDGTMYVLDTGTGKVVGKLPVGGPVGSAPLTITGQVYVGTSKGVLYKLYYDDFTNSTQVNWKFPADGAITGTPVPAPGGDTIFAATTRGTVYQVQPGPDLGTALWNCHVGGPVRSGLAVYNGVAYAGSDDGYLYAIDISTGTVRWKYKTGGAIRGSVLAARGLVYFGSLDHRVYALRA
jgi:outer membrane protein assembly factor BamB